MNITIIRRALKENYAEDYPSSTSGYLLPDGRWLDLILKGDKDRGGWYRNDHRCIGCYLNRSKYEEGQSGTDRMYRFMRYGNIRFMPESGSFEFIKRPTREQIWAIQDYARRNRGEITIERVAMCKSGYYSTVWTTNNIYEFMKKYGR